MSLENVYCDTVTNDYCPNRSTGEAAGTGWHISPFGSPSVNADKRLPLSPSPSAFLVLKRLRKRFLHPAQTNVAEKAAVPKPYRWKRVSANGKPDRAAFNVLEWHTCVRIFLKAILSAGDGERCPLSSASGRMCRALSCTIIKKSPCKRNNSPIKFTTIFFL